MDSLTAAVAERLRYEEALERRKQECEKAAAEWSPWFNGLTDFQKGLLATFHKVEAWEASGAVIETITLPDDTVHAVKVISPPLATYSQWAAYRLKLMGDDVLPYVNYMCLRVPNMLTHQVLCPVVGAELPRSTWDHPDVTEWCDKENQRGRNSIRWTVIHLNDSHEWSFTQIADWLESLDVDLSFPMPQSLEN